MMRDDATNVDRAAELIDAVLSNETLDLTEEEKRAALGMVVSRQLDHDPEAALVWMRFLLQSLTEDES